MTGQTSVQCCSMHVSVTDRLPNSHGVCGTDIRLSTAHPWSISCHPFTSLSGWADTCWQSGGHVRTTLLLL